MNPFSLICILFLAGLSCANATDITMWQCDLQHTGQNLHETDLTPQNIGSNGNFGYLFSQTLDGQSYGQPLLVSGIKIGDKPHNIVYVTTEHDSIYAFDADSNGAPLWHDLLLPTGTQSVPQTTVGSSDISIEIGITATPVIDTATHTIYVATKIQETADGSCQQYLHALDLATGAEKFHGPVLIHPTFSGDASDGRNGIIPFNPLRENMRAALTLYKGVVYICYGSLSDINPYHGEILGYDATSLALVRSFITSPNGNSPEGGIWQSGAGPAIDDSGKIYVAVANGLWDQNPSQYTSGTNWGESIIRLSTDTVGVLNVPFSDTTSWFTPDVWQELNSSDLDLGSTGLLLLPDEKGPHSHIMVCGSKGGILYVLDRDDLGGMHSPDYAIQEVHEMGGASIFATPAYFNGNIYYSAAGGPLEQRAVEYDEINGNYIAPTPIISAWNYGGRGSGVFISANGSRNGIAWILNGMGLDAYDARNVSGAPIYTGSAIVPPNIECKTAKFGLPIVANDKAYFTGFDSTNTGHLFVFGPLSSLNAPETPANPVATAISSSQITVDWTADASVDVRFIIEHSTSSTGPFNPITTVGAKVCTIIDSGLRADTEYFYQVRAFNSKGESAESPITSAKTFPFYNQPGLVAYWNFDDGNSSTIADVTGNGHNGTVRGEVISATGLINGAYTFHGAGVSTAHLIIPNTPALQFSAAQSFTLSAWVNPAHLPGIEQAIIAKSADQGSKYGIWINAKNQWTFRGPKGDLAGPTAIEGKWSHIAIVQDADAYTRKIYVNGLLAGTQATSQPADGAGDLWLGQQNVPSAPESFPGLIDEVRLYNRALPANEISTLLGPPIVETLLSEPQDALTKGRLIITLSFSAPVSDIGATLNLQNGGVTNGRVDSITYDRNRRKVTLILDEMGHHQALNLHLSGIQPGNGTEDIPLNLRTETSTINATN